VDILNTAIGHIVKLVDALSIVLNIPLPHRMSAFSLNGMSTIFPQFMQDSKVYILSPITWQYSRERLRGVNWVTMADLQAKASQMGVESSSKHTVPSNVDDYNDMTINSDFSQAIVLLQANIVTLCIKSGLQASSLWPAEALLLNLKTLEMFAERALAKRTVFEVQDTSAHCEDESFIALKKSFCERFSTADVAQPDIPLKDQLSPDDIQSIPIVTPPPTTIHDDEWDLVNADISDYA
jgi:hypothetical protein